MLEKYFLHITESIGCNFAIFFVSSRQKSDDVEILQYTD